MNGIKPWHWGMAGAFLLAGGAALARSQYERTQLSVERISLSSPKLKRKLTLVFLSDLHNREFGEENRGLVHAVEAVDPDLVLIGGDTMITKGEKDLSIALSLIGQLSRHYPVIAGNGNHEIRMREETECYGDLYQCYCQEMRQMGVILLENEAVQWGENIRIHGLDLTREYYRPLCPQELTAGMITQKLGVVDSGQYHILLAHSPLFFSAYEQWGADLTLAGHFHGGTIRLPWVGGVMTPQYQFFHPYCGGTFERNGHYLLVSRGLGTHSVNIRLNNKPQVMVVEIN